MSNGIAKRTRSDIVGSLGSQPGQFARIVRSLHRTDVLARIGLCILAALTMWAVTGAWAPHFSFRLGFIPQRDIVARVAFRQPNESETKIKQMQARREAICIYQHDVRPIVEVRQGLKDRILRLLSIGSFDRFTVEDRVVWEQFLRGMDASAAPMNPEQLYSEFREAFSEDMQLANFDRAIQRALLEFERDGLLAALDHPLEYGSQQAILVHPVGNAGFLHRVEVKDVRIAEASSKLLDKINMELKGAGIPEARVSDVATAVFNWLKPRLPTTLTINREASEKSRQEAEKKVPPATVDFVPGDKLATGGRPLTKEDLDLLQAEHRVVLAGQSFAGRIRHSFADLGMFFAVFVLCGTYLYFHVPVLMVDLRRFATVLGLLTVTVALSRLVSIDEWRAEIVPLVMFGMIITIAYERELALLLSAVAGLIITLSLGQGLPEFVIQVAAVYAAILLIGRIRSRTKLIYVGLGAAAVAAFTTIGVGTLMGQAFGASRLPGFVPTSDGGSTFGLPFAIGLFTGSCWYAFCGLLAGILMTGLLPFVERLMDVQTDISLLELGDAAHPLLQELVRRAPGTYNHSINVASLAEAAAESIGANGLLVRVGAYFHDIGKMLKPTYFVENQGQTGNRHESLLPAMSTLVIIAHVKDGADLARKNSLPQSIIDFIEQHHGTTLVEYFYRQEAKRQEQEGEDAEEVDEFNFRYPGPKPQTKEAAVLMLADAVEGASRTLVDPAPSRLENLVRELSMKRLLDGQFEECALTFSELNAVCDSLSKSLIAVYHGRVKYPSQQSA